jgi:predicted transcriptional regulator
MSTTITIRIDEQTERELAELTKSGTSRNAVITCAIHREYRRVVHARIRRESEALREDPDYQAEVRAAREDMGADSAW